jgi:diaminopimelate epimerase
MRVEKWQALGNDYVIVERDALPWPLTAERIVALCDPHHGLGADGVLELAPPGDRPGVVAVLRIFNPDGSEAELSGNGAREAILYLRRAGWTDLDEFSIWTAAGEIRPTILSDRECRVAMGRAVIGERGEIGGAAFQHVRIGNPQTAIQMPSVAALEALDLAVLGPVIETDPRFPQRTNVSWYAEDGEGRIRARIFERGVGETLSSGTGACGAAIVHFLRGGGSPIVVALDGGDLLVDIDAQLDVALTGWAEFVYGADLSPALLDRLAAL